MKTVKVSVGSLGELTMTEPVNRVLKKRYRSILTKEPTTIEWLSSFEKGEVFVDIGANIGLYSLIAAKFRGCDVYAFEPQALNYAELCKNIYLNELHNIMAYCVAITDRMSMMPLYVSEMVIGQSHNDFGYDRAVQADDSAKDLHKKFPNRVKQGCVGLTLDWIIDSGWVSWPTHVKIDVDGFEPQVIAGMANTLSGELLQSVLIEIDHRIPGHVELVKQMRTAGWEFDPKQVSRSLPTSKSEFNYIFHR